MDSQDKDLVNSLIVSAFEQHKTHARHQESQRSWILAAFFTMTGLIWAGWALIINSSTIVTNEKDIFLYLLFGFHLFIGFLMMIASSKVSGEFKRHFTRAERILHEIEDYYKSEEGSFPQKAFSILSLETSTVILDKDRSINNEKLYKRKFIGLRSNSAMHAYIYSSITAIDLFYILYRALKQELIWIPIIVSIFWALFSAVFIQIRYIYKIENTDTSTKVVVNEKVDK